MQNSIEQILDWVAERNKNTKVNINKIAMSDCANWFLDEKDGYIRNHNNSFFQIAGLRQTDLEGNVVTEQPILLQSEIGYLGILCKDFGDETHFLMQAKIEPGNINKIQLSPTIQATKSNFTQKHGGRKPAYLDYFLNATGKDIIVDQIQSEQSSRFLAKRNRNIIVKTEEDVEVLPTHKWMTLPQIKQLMKVENLVNMDTRTVLSCMPFSLHGKDHWAKLGLPQDYLENTCNGDGYNYFPTVYNKVNNYKMFNDINRQLVPLTELETWNIEGDQIVHREEYPFKVIFCEIEIEGREVTKWAQPLFEANGIATFGLLTYKEAGINKFIVKLRPEVGCFDKVELGPTIQREAGEKVEPDVIENLFDAKYNANQNVIFDNILSEEGGRFYHEQNKNIIIALDPDEVPELPNDYIAVDYRNLNLMVQVNNCLSIQLRNLLSVWETN